MGLESLDGVTRLGLNLHKCTAGAEQGIRETHAGSLLSAVGGQVDFVNASLLRNLGVKDSIWQSRAQDELLQSCKDASAVIRLAEHDW